MTASILGGFHRFCKSVRSARRESKKKDGNVCTVMVLLHIYSKSLGVRLPVCPVNKNKILMLIKLLSSIQILYLLPASICLSNDWWRGGWGMSK